MKRDKADGLLAEITNNEECTGIDKTDVESFKSDVNEIDAEKVVGKTKDFMTIAEKTIASIRERNGGKDVRGLLLDIRLLHEDDSMEFYDNINDLIDRLGYDTNCIWGISYKGSLQENELEMTVVVGF